MLLFRSALAGGTTLLIGDDRTAEAEAAQRHNREPDARVVIVPRLGGAALYRLCCCVLAAVPAAGLRGLDGQLCLNVAVVELDGHGMLMICDAY